MDITEINALTEILELEITSDDLEKLLNEVRHIRDRHDELIRVEIDADTYRGLLRYIQVLLQSNKDALEYVHAEVARQRNMLDLPPTDAA